MLPCHIGHWWSLEHEDIKGRICSYTCIHMHAHVFYTGRRVRNPRNLVADCLYVEWRMFMSWVYFYVFVTGPKFTCPMLWKAETQNIRIWSREKFIDREITNGNDARPSGASNPSTECTELSLGFFSVEEGARGGARVMDDRWHLGVSRVWGRLYAGCWP